MVAGGEGGSAGKVPANPIRVYVRAALAEGTMKRRRFPEGEYPEREEEYDPFLYTLAVGVDVTHRRPLAASERALPVSLDPRPQPAAGRKPRFLQAVASNVTLPQAWPPVDSVIV